MGATNLLTPDAYLEGLISNYNQFSVDAALSFASQDLTPYFLYPDGINASIQERGYWWCRHMILTKRFCFANIQLPEDLRGKGIFTRFLSYIKSHPHIYSGVKVESIQNDRLISFLNEKGFKSTPKREIDDGALLWNSSPSLILEF